jgi:hypothetical protein
MKVLRFHKWVSLCITCTLPFVLYFCRWLQQLRLKRLPFLWPFPPFLALEVVTSDKKSPVFLEIIRKCGRGSERQVSARWCKSVGGCSLGMLTKWRSNGIDRTSRTGAKYGHMGNERSALVWLRLNWHYPLFRSRKTTLMNANPYWEWQKAHQALQVSLGWYVYSSICFLSTSLQSYNA